MANRGVKGRVVDEHGTGIEHLTVRAVDFDPFFHEDDVLKTAKTNGSGDFQLDYVHEDVTFWDPHRNPDIVVQIFGPCRADPEQFGNRLLHETAEQEDVAVEILDVGTITIHRDNIDGWLVTHTTMNPATAVPVALFAGNAITHLVDGADMFPAVTDAAMQATRSINLMQLFFDVDNHLITKFKSTFNPADPPSTNCMLASEATLEDELLVQAAAPNSRQVNVLVADIPFSADDTLSEVRKKYEHTGVHTAAFKKGLSILHAKAMIVDGDKAFLMGSPLKQYYFSDERHAIYDARHKGSLMHDVNVLIEGPAVAHIDKTFATFWKASGGSPIAGSPVAIPPWTGDTVTSLQVLRTLPGGTFTASTAADEDLPHGETGILEAYERAINNAERFIYLENQYFTSPEIVNALICRMKETSKPKLQIILVLNHRPDLPGYPSQQIDNVNQLKLWAKAHGHQLGVYTMWSRAAIGSSDGQTRFEIMPIYVHSKVAIIDDTWATVGTANLDGTSLNYHEIGMMVSGGLTDRFVDKIKLIDDGGRFLWEVFWYLFFFILKEMVFNFTTLAAILGIAYKLITDFKGVMEVVGDVPDIRTMLQDVFARTAPHALPNRGRQPSRNLELNVVLYNGIAGQPATDRITELRKRLWREHLGFETLPPVLVNVPPDAGVTNWVELWDERANEYLELIKNDQLAPAFAPKVLPWAPETDAEEYLRALEVRTTGLRKQAHKYLFKTCKPEKKPVFPWPII